MEEAIQKAGFEYVKAYVLSRHNKFTQYILTQPIMHLCKEAMKRPGTGVTRRWWFQEGIYLVETRSADVAAYEEGPEEAEGEAEVVMGN